MLTFFFKNYNFKILKTQHFLKKIYIYVFPYKTRLNSLLQYILYFEKFLITKYFLRCVYGVTIIKNIKPTIKNKNKEPKINKCMFFLFYFTIKVLILKRLIGLKTIQSLDCKKIYLLSENNIFLNFKGNQIFLKKKFFRLLVLQELLLINSILKFKYLELYCSLLCFFYTEQALSIHITSVFDKPFLFYKIPFFFKYLKKYFLKQKLYIISLSFIFFKGEIILSYIHNIVKKTKNKKHLKNLFLFFQEVKTTFKTQYIPLYGFKFRIAGRLGGKLRKSTFYYKLGNLKLLTFNTFVNYSFYVVHTLYGVFSLKLWLCILDEHNQLLA